MQKIDIRSNKDNPFQYIQENLEKKDVYLSMIGDDGGQVYLTIPITYLKNLNSMIRIERLHIALDTLCWFCNEGEMMQWYFVEDVKTEQGFGGMSGSKLIDKLWVHQELNEFYDVIYSILTCEFGKNHVMPITCPICYFPGIKNYLFENKVKNNEICPCCGVKFGKDWSDESDFVTMNKLKQNWHNGDKKIFNLELYTQYYIQHQELIFSRNTKKID